MSKRETVFMEFFGAGWCGHCKDFLPTWNKMKEYCANNKEYSNYVFNMYDEKDHTARIKGKEQRGLKIQGYPSLYVCYKDKAVEYNGHRSQEDILKFAKNIVEKQYGGNNRKMIRGKGFTYYGRCGEMRGGGRVYAVDVDLVELVNKKIKYPEYRRNDDFVYIEMGGFKSSDKPMATKGLATCIGIGFSIEGINYFGHMSKGTYSNASSAIVMEINKIFGGNESKIENVYLFGNGSVCMSMTPVLNIINIHGLIDNTYYVPATIQVFDESKGYGVQKGEFTPYYVVGIDSNGPWCYEYSESEEDKTLHNTRVPKK